MKALFTCNVSSSANHYLRHRSLCSRSPCSRREARWLGALLLGSALVGCAGEDAGTGNSTDSVGGGSMIPGTSGTPATGTTSDPTQPATTATDGATTGACLSDGGVDEDGNMLLLADPANNYSFSSSISVEVVTVAANTELFFDWSTLTQDFLGHPVDPLNDIDTLALILWDLTLEEMTEKLNADELTAQYAAAAITRYNDNEVTSTSIFDFTVAGGGELPRADLMSRLDPTQYDPAQFTYALMPQTGGVLGQNVKMVKAFTLDPNSTTTTVDITPTSTSLEYSVSLTELLPVKVPAGQTNVLVDWSEIETTALARDWKIRSIEEVMVAKYSLTPAELEAQFLDIETIADEMYRGQVLAGDEFVLTDLVEQTTQQPFTGITSDGTWVLALVCSRCGNPAPWYLTQLQPCGQ